MICFMCKKEKPRLIKIYIKDRVTRKSEQSDVCTDCEGEMERPFVVYIKSHLARSFIQSVKSKGWFVKDTMVQMMKDFVKEEKNGK